MTSYDSIFNFFLKFLNVKDKKEENYKNLNIWRAERVDEVKSI